MFNDLKQLLAVALGDLALSIEHVGSTSVPGLGAKPTIDLDIVIESNCKLPPVISRLAELGYFHEGDLDVPGREAFGRVDESVPRHDIGRVWLNHNLYVCPQDSEALAEHLALRDHLRVNPDGASSYEALKRQLAKQFPHDLDSYSGGKSAFIGAALGRGPRVEVPGTVALLTAGHTWHAVTIGDSAAQVFKLERQDHPTRFLKVGPLLPEKEILAEKERLEWLTGKLPVPEVLRYDTDEKHEYLVTSAITGTDTTSASAELGAPTIARLLARGLRLIHEVPISDCPFVMTLDTLIPLARENTLDGRVDEGNFDEIRMGRTAQDLLEELASSVPPKEDLVFTHGDYCLPNVLVNAGEVAGFVDLSRAGIADRYKDIALVIRSIRHNTGQEVERLFLDEYGIIAADAAKIEYYMLLDEFF